MKKKTTALVAAITLVTAPIFFVDAAHATPVTPTLSYDDFKASQGYQDLSALGAASNRAYDAMQGLEMITTLHAKVTVEATLDMTVDIKTNKTDSTSVTTTAPSQGIIDGTTSYYYSNGRYLLDAKTYESAAKNSFNTNNLPDTLKRLGKSQDTVISTNYTSPPGSLADISPAAFIAQVGQDGLSSISASKLNLLFSPIVCAAPIEAPDTKVCTYRASTSALASIATIFIDVSLTFDATGFMTAMSIAESSDPVGLVFNINVSLAPLNGWTQTLPTNVVADTQVIAMGRQLNAETIASSQANKVVAKAKVLAKKSKAKLTPTHLTQAAKLLKQKFAKIKGGVKVSTKWLGVPGNACAVVAKGKVSVKPC